jgi:ubiquinone/menaquinone biosynthesis C-methylase UbiE
VNVDDNVFEQLADKYDTAERKKSADIIVKRVRPELAGSTTASFIDYGSGTGLVSLALADLVESVLLVDSSGQMLEAAEAKISQRGLANCRVLHADFKKEIPEIKADIIFMSLVLLHIPDTDGMLRTLFRLVNNGGKLIIVDFDKNEKVHHPAVHHGFSHSRLKKQLSGAGFISTDISTFYRGRKIFMKQDASMFLAVSRKQAEQ